MTRWEDKALDNETKWGSQSIEMLLLALAEEYGELVQAYLEYVYEDGDEASIQAELDDVMALGYQVEWRLNDGIEGQRRCLECGFPLRRNRHAVINTPEGPKHLTCPTNPE